MQNSLSDQTVAANVRAEVPRRRIPQRDLAAALDMDQRSFSRRVTGGGPAFTASQVRILADRIGVHLSTLLGDTEAASV